METTYQLTKKQNFFQKNIESFVKQKIAPRVLETDQREGFPREILDQLAGNRLLGMLVSKDAGGEGAGFFDFCLALEGIAEVCPTSALICATQDMGARIISKEGTPDQKEAYLSKLMAGEAVFGYVLPQLDMLSLVLNDIPLSGSKEDEGFLFNDSECTIINGDAADVICLFAGNGDLANGFLIESGIQGLAVAEPKGMTGAEARCMCRAVLDNCRISKQYVLGKEGEGEKIWSELLLEGSCLTAGIALGIGQGALDYAIRYSKQREQFGLQIAKFQAVRILLAEMATKVEAVRHFVYKVAAAMDQNSRDRHKLCSMAKTFSSKMIMEVTTDAIQVCGGYGYMKDYPQQKMMRNAQLTQVINGSNQSHQLATSRWLLG
ncbi:MAG: acyl-CoA dehydrogenase family protein [Deltaproteobacteria bacterium]|uniref:Acyl-CoA dehydrogenase family protein n=1 Tax=Candidatus Desulfacyla euxinica TaxID=2841693 RepID=A0A8J6N4A2_9DELT|nr:acyl-CoA dehydrogenase family protein [Candidatus Desulfacyla euxinica]